MRPHIIEVKTTEAEEKAKNLWTLNQSNLPQLTVGLSPVDILQTANFDFL